MPPFGAVSHLVEEHVQVNKYTRFIQIPHWHPSRAIRGTRISSPTPYPTAAYTNTRHSLRTPCNVSNGHHRKRLDRLTEVVLRVARAPHLGVQAALGTVLVRVVAVAYVAEHVQLVGAQEERGGEAVDWRVAPALDGDRHVSARSGMASVC